MRCLLICFSRKAEEPFHIKRAITDWVINRVGFLACTILYRPSLPTSLTAKGKEKRKLADRCRRTSSVGRKKVNDVLACT